MIAFLTFHRYLKKYCFYLNLFFVNFVVPFHISASKTLIANIPDLGLVSISYHFKFATQILFIFCKKIEFVRKRKTLRAKTFL